MSCRDCDRRAECAETDRPDCPYETPPWERGWRDYDEALRCGAVTGRERHGEDTG